MDSYFWIDIGGWVIKYFTFLMVGSAKFLPRKIFLFGATPAINNDRSLSTLKSIFMVNLVVFNRKWTFWAKIYYIYNTILLNNLYFYKPCYMWWRQKQFLSLRDLRPQLLLDVMMRERQVWTLDGDHLSKTVPST